MFNFVSSGKECGSDQFSCRDNSYCIPNSWKCDKVGDCPDSSDEDGCGMFLVIRIFRNTCSYRILKIFFTYTWLYSLRVFLMCDFKNPANYNISLL